MKVPTECPAIDNLLEGGLEPGIVTLVYGEPASGKTNLCLQVARSVVRSGLKVAYVDSEGVSFDRLRQVGGESYRDMMEKTLFSTPLDLEDQERRVEQIRGLPEVGAVIVDSLNQHYRLELDDTQAASRSLLAQLGALQRVAREARVPVVVTAQVYGSEEEVLPFGWKVMGHIVKTVLEFRREPESLRRVILRKHRAIPEGRSNLFRITERGLE